MECAVLNTKYTPTEDFGGGGAAGVWYIGRSFTRSRLERAMDAAEVLPPRPLSFQTRKPAVDAVMEVHRA